MTRGPQSATRAAVTEHAARGRAAALLCLDLLHQGLVPDPGHVQAAVDHLRAALGRTGKDDSEEGRDPSLTLLLAEILIASCPEDLAAAAEARRLLRDTLRLVDASGPSSWPSIDTARVQALIVSTGSALVARAREQRVADLGAAEDAFAADCEAYLRQPADAGIDRRTAAALLMSVLAARSRDATRRLPDDVERLLELATMRRAHAPLCGEEAFAVEAALSVAEALCSEYPARRDPALLVEAVRLLDDHQDVVDARSPELRPVYDAVLATLVAAAPPGSPLRARQQEAADRIGWALSGFPAGDPDASLLQRIRRALVRRADDHSLDDWLRSEAAGAVSAVEEARTATTRAAGVRPDSLTTVADVATLADLAERLDLDAVVYLFAESAGRDRGSRWALSTADLTDAGGALVVRRDGVAAWVGLPELTLDHGGPADRYVSAYDDLLLSADPVAAEQHWREALPAAGRWAWDAVLDPLSQLVPPSIPGLPSRVALIPFGPLGVIPWQAAYPAADSDRPHARRRYAVARFVLSYVASASLLFRVAERRPRRLADHPVFVLNAEVERSGPGPETAALVDCLYPHATVRPNASGPDADPVTPDDVVAALSRQGCSLLHVTAPLLLGRDRSGWALRIGTGVLGAERVLQVRTGDFGYTACLSPQFVPTSQAPGDLAASPATAFLAGGATAVFESRWDVDRAAAVVRSFMLHHHLASGVPPGDALQRTQLWMRDTERRLPAAMPQSVRTLVTATDLTDPVAWAGTVHHGR